MSFQLPCANDTKGTAKHSDINMKPVTIGTFKSECRLVVHGQRM